MVHAKTLPGSRHGGLRFHKPMLLNSLFCFLFLWVGENRTTESRSKAVEQLNIFKWTHFTLLFLLFLLTKC